MLDHLLHRAILREGSVLVAVYAVIGACRSVRFRAEIGCRLQRHPATLAKNHLIHLHRLLFCIRGRPLLPGSVVFVQPAGRRLRYKDNQFRDSGTVRGLNLFSAIQKTTSGRGILPKVVLSGKFEISCNFSDFRPAIRLRRRVCGCEKSAYP